MVAKHLPNFEGLKNFSCFRIPFVEVPKTPGAYIGPTSRQEYIKVGRFAVPAVGFQPPLELSHRTAVQLVASPALPVVLRSLEYDILKALTNQFPYPLKYVGFLIQLSGRKNRRRFAKLFSSTIAVLVENDLIAIEPLAVHDQRNLTGVIDPRVIITGKGLLTERQFRTSFRR
jgi:CO dehydrogenase/acetyl-CoA synthase gamma subunit (corrinoid Fe-S protein)